MTKSIATATPPARLGESRLLTPTQLSTHLACAHYTQLERRRRAGELEVMPDPRLEAMRERGAQHERAYIERLGRADLTALKSTIGRQQQLAKLDSEQDSTRQSSG